MKLDFRGFVDVRGIKLDHGGGKTSMREAQVEEEGFRRAEASCLLEGIDPNQSAPYVAIKARVLGGEIDIDKAIQVTVDHYKSLAESRVSDYAVAD